MTAGEGAARVYRSMWPLPGGHGRFLATLLEILGWMQSHEQPTHQDLYSWMRERYSLGAAASTPEGYVQLVVRMGYLKSQRGGSVGITERGLRLLTTRDPQLVLDSLLAECDGADEVLAAVGRLGAATGKTLLSEFQSRRPYWTTSIQYDWRLQWLHSLGCLERAGGSYIITPLGERTLREYSAREAGHDPRAATMTPSGGGHAATMAAAIDMADPQAPPDDHPDIDIDAPPDVPAMLVIQDEAERLAERIRHAALESDDAIGFERALVDVFRFLGFDAEHKSGPGDTDLLVNAALGQESYRAVVDGKSSRHGKIGKQQVEWFALGRHRDMYRADYILVVAPGFSSGDLLDNATKSDAGLLTADDLAAVIRLHARTPLSLSDLRELFRYAGHPELPLQRVQEKAAEVARLQRLLPDIVRAFEHSYRVGVSGPIAADALHLILARDYGRAVYTRDEIVSALDLLCTPLVGALRKVTEHAYSLQMPITSVGRRFQAQARQLLEGADVQLASGGHQATRQQ